MQILLTAFEPYSGVKINSSEWVASHLKHRLPWPNFHVEILPTEFAAASSRISELLVRLRPDVAVSLGMASGDPSIRLERYAVNCMSTRRPDNAGFQPDESTAEGLPEAYRANAPLRDLQAMLKNNRIPSVVSNSAGTYVCNAVMFSALHTIAREGLATRHLFVHIPALPDELAGRDDMGGPCMSLEEEARAVECILFFLSEPESRRRLLTYLPGDGLLLRPWQDRDLARVVAEFAQAEEEIHGFRTAAQISNWWSKVRYRQRCFSYAVCTPAREIAGELSLENPGDLRNPALRARIFPSSAGKGLEEGALKIFREFAAKPIN